MHRGRIFRPRYSFKADREKGSYMTQIIRTEDTSFHAQDIRIFAAVFAISFIQALQYGVSPVLNQIADHYSGVNVSLVQMLITAPSLVGIFFALASGWLVTKVSKKQQLVLASVITLVTGFVPFLVDSFALLFAARVIYGIALGSATTLNSAVVSEFFEGKKRTVAMGIQAASIGIGMVLVTTGSGFLGNANFKTSYWINLLALLSLILLVTCLPETGTVKAEKAAPIRLSATVWITAVFAFLEFFFLITFTTNIAMHLSTYGISSGQAGITTGIFSGAQIAMGFLLGVISRYTGKMTLPVAMLSFAGGALLVIAFPENALLLSIGAILCGFSQGAFIPTAYVTASNASDPAAIPMASAIVTAATMTGQLLSAPVLNTCSALLFHSSLPATIFLMASVGMGISAAACAVWQLTKKDKQ